MHEVRNMRRPIHHRWAIRQYAYNTNPYNTSIIRNTFDDLFYTGIIRVLYKKIRNMIFNMMGKYKLNIIVTKVLVYVGILVSRYLGGFTDTEPRLQYKNGI